MAAKKDVTETKKSQVPSTVPDYGTEMGAGFEGTTAQDLSVPFLSILQGLSPQVEDNDPEGARAGMLYNTVTRELIDGDAGVVLLPVHKDHSFVEWVPRDQGGGFVGQHSPTSDVVKQAIADNDGQRFGKLQTPEGNDLIETHYVYGLMLDSEGKESIGFGVVSFTSTKIKPCRDWMTAMYTIKGRPPLFANRATLRTTKQKNEKGTFFNFRIDPLHSNWRESLIDPKNEEALLTEAREFRDMVQSGMAQAAFDTEHATGSASEQDNKPAF